MNYFIALLASLPPFTLLASSAAFAQSEDFFAGKDVIVYDPPKVIIADAGGKCEGHVFKADEPDKDIKSPYPTLRCLPVFPFACMQKIQESGSVDYFYDINSAGEPYNVRAVRATHECMVDPGAISVAGARFSESENGITNRVTTVSILLED